MLNPLLQLRRARRGWYGMSAVVCLAAGMVLAWHHPLWPAAALVLLAFATLLGACSTTAWLLVVPACLPFLQFAPWTGWLIFDEFDLLLLGTLAGGFISDRASKFGAKWYALTPAIGIAITLGAASVTAVATSPSVTTTGNATVHPGTATVSAVATAPDLRSRRTSEIDSTFGELARLISCSCVIVAATTGSVWNVL